MGCGQRHVPAALPPGMTWYPLYKRLGGPQGRSGGMREISPPTGVRSPDRPAPIASRYTYCAIPAHITMCTGSFPGIKRQVCGVNHPPPISAEDEERAELFLPLCAFMAGYTVKCTELYTQHVTNKTDDVYLHLNY